jgi:ribosomal protein L7Ae-like RNA K-turn-binding protein
VNETKGKITRKELLFLGTTKVHNLLPRGKSLLILISKSCNKTKQHFKEYTSIIAGYTKQVQFRSAFHQKSQETRSICSIVVVKKAEGISITHEEKSLGTEVQKF